MALFTYNPICARSFSKITAAFVYSLSLYLRTRSSLVGHDPAIFELSFQCMVLNYSHKALPPVPWSIGLPPLPRGPLCPRAESNHNVSHCTITTYSTSSSPD